MRARSQTDVQGTFLEIKNKGDDLKSMPVHGPDRARAWR